MTLGDLIRRGVRLYGDQTAVVFEGRRYTYREQAARIYRLANALLDMGVRRQERVAILARNCSEYIEVFGAGEVSGFITVNLNNRLSAQELAAICVDCQPAVLIYADEYSDTARLVADASGSIRHRICIGAEPDGSALAYEDVLAGSGEEEPAVRAEADDTAYLMYTSGSTGRPKGVMLGHRAVIEASRILSHETGAEPTERALIVMPLCHLGGKIEQMGFTFMGGAIILHRAFDAEAVLAAIETEKITAAHLAPIMVQRLLDCPQLASYDTSTLRNVQYASAPMPVPLLRRALAKFGPIFTQVYGMSECMVGTILKAHHHRPDGDEADMRRLGSAGHPVFGNEVIVVRPDGSFCEPDEIGEILIRSATMMQGYWNNHTGSTETLRGGWTYTQDLGCIDRNGFVYVMDRKKDMIISGGENIYSWEVEEALRSHDAVAEVAVIAVPDPEWGEAVKACVVLREVRQASEQDLIDHCRQRIASYKKPRSVDFVDSLPRLFNGKVDKKALRAAYWSGRDRAVA